MPLLLGATLGDANRALLERLEQYGMELGLVFQLRDDWIGFDKDMAKNNKRTFATMYGKQTTEEAIQSHWEAGKRLAGNDVILLGLLEWVATRTS